MAGLSSLDSTPLRALRLERGLSQIALAREAGISRQAYAAIEAGRSVPSTEVALRLAAELECTVEDLFRLSSSAPSTLEAIDGGLGPVGSPRVRLARIGGRAVAHRLEIGGAHAALPADGLVLEGPGTAAEADLPHREPSNSPAPTVDPILRIRPFAARPRFPDLVVAGCDPAFGLVVGALAERGIDVLWIPAGSEAALGALARRTVHVAGVHLRDPDTGAYNAPGVARLVPFPATRIAFSVWEQSLVLAPGNPLGIGGVEDLARRGLRLLNREPGSGARVLLDHHLAQAGIDPSAIPGYRGTAARGHQDVVGAVAAGAADVGVAIRAAARSAGLTAIHLASEPYELVIPDLLLETPAVGALLDLLRSPSLRRQVEAMGGYDATSMGRVA